MPEVPAAAKSARARGALVSLVGDGVLVPCVDGQSRPYINLDCAASTPAMDAVAAAVNEQLPWYSSVHRGAGYKSRHTTDRYEQARQAILRFCGREPGSDDVAIICRNTTEAINHLAYRLRLDPAQVVVTTVVEHHANLLPWGRVATRRYVECSEQGTFSVDDVVTALDAKPRPCLLAVTGASNVTGWLPPIDPIIRAAHERDIPVLVDAAQLAPHRPIPSSADFVALSGHKCYAPFGAGALVGPRSAFRDGDPFLAGGGAVDLVDLEEVWWTEPPEREEAGSPNVLGAIALRAAIEELLGLGWDSVMDHEMELGRRLRDGLASIEGVRLLGPALDSDQMLATAAFTVDHVHHALVAARLSAEWGIGVRHGCFCAHPYLMRLLHLSEEAVAQYRLRVKSGDHSATPGAVRASCGLSNTLEDVDRLIEAVSVIADDGQRKARLGFDYRQDPRTGDFWPEGFDPEPGNGPKLPGSGCALG